MVCIIKVLNTGHLRSFSCLGTPFFTKLREILRIPRALITGGMNHMVDIFSICPLSAWIVYIHSPGRVVWTNRPSIVMLLANCASRPLEVGKFIPKEPSIPDFRVWHFLARLYVVHRLNASKAYVLLVARGGMAVWVETKRVGWFAKLFLFNGQKFIEVHAIRKCAEVRRCGNAVVLGGVGGWGHDNTTEYGKIWRKGAIFVCGLVPGFVSVQSWIGIVLPWDFGKADHGFFCDSAAGYKW